MLGGDLKTNGGVVKIPSGVYREDFDAGVKCGFGELLSIVVDDMGDRVPEPR